MSRERFFKVFGYSKRTQNSLCFIICLCKPFFIGLNPHNMLLCFRRCSLHLKPQCKENTMITGYKVFLDLQYHISVTQHSSSFCDRNFFLLQYNTSEGHFISSNLFLYNLKQERLIIIFSKSSGVT